MVMRIVIERPGHAAPSTLLICQPDGAGSANVALISVTGRLLISQRGEPNECALAASAKLEAIRMIRGR